MKKIAVLDFDGTLSKGYISIELLEYLHKHGLYSEDFYKKQMKILEEHQKGWLSYEDWCYNWGELWAEGLKGKNVDLIKRGAYNFFQEFKSNIYPLSYEIITFLKKKGYKVILLSVGASEVISLAEKELGVDELYCTKLNEVSGIFTGKTSTSLHELNGKEELMQELLHRKDLSPKHSLAMGDSHSDIGFMSMCEHPIAVNPDEKLKEYAQKNDWLILNLAEDAEKIMEELKKELKK